MITLINNATTIGQGEGTTIGWGKDEANTTHTFQITCNGSPSRVKVQIQGTIDGTNYACILEHEMTAEELANDTAIFHLINKPVPKIRASITELSGGVSPTVSVYYYKGE